jgi:hypothetical protein
MANPTWPKPNWELVGCPWKGRDDEEINRLELELRTRRRKSRAIMENSVDFDLGTDALPADEISDADSDRGTDVMPGDESIAERAPDKDVGRDPKTNVDTLPVYDYGSDVDRAPDIDAQSEDQKESIVDKTPPASFATVPPGPEEPEDHWTTRPEHEVHNDSSGTEIISAMTDQVVRAAAPGTGDDRQRPVYDLNTSSINY